MWLLLSCEEDRECAASPGPLTEVGPSSDRKAISEYRLICILTGGKKYVSWMEHSRVGRSLQPDCLGLKCVVLGKLRILPVPQFPYLYKGDNNSPYAIEFL